MSEAERERPSVEPEEAPAPPAEPSAPEKSTEPAAEKSTEPAAEKPAEAAAKNPAEAAAQKPTEAAAKKSAGPAAEKPAEAKPAEAAAEKPAEEKPAAEKPAAPPPKPKLTISSLSVVIPAHNEEETIAKTLVSLKSTLIEAEIEAEIILVDDGSTDATAERAGAIDGVWVIRHPGNLGYGAALKTGIRASRGEIVATLDADGQHDPRDLVPMLAMLGETNSMVVGHRQGAVQSTLLRAPGKWLLTTTAQYLVGRKIPDLNCGFRVFRREVVARQLHLCPNGFSISTTLTMSLMTDGYPLAYHPIQVLQREGGKSRVSAVTGLAALILLFRLVMLFNPLRVFLPLSLLSLGLGVFVGAVDTLRTGRPNISDSAVLFLVVAVLIFLFGLVADSIARLRRELRPGG